MTLTQKIKTGLIKLLSDELGSDITILDAKSLAAFDLPLLAIDAPTTAAHSEALQMVERITITAILRAHAGDHEPGDLDELIGWIESILANSSEIRRTLDAKVYSWVYNGSVQDWSESVIEIRFDAECLAARI
jgi:hypothetical protein